MSRRRQTLAEAHRARAGAIGLLASCDCAYPLERAPTSTFHAETCQSHAMTLSAIAAGEGYHIADWRKL